MKWQSVINDRKLGTIIIINEYVYSPTNAADIFTYIDIDKHRINNIWIDTGQTYTKVTYIIIIFEHQICTAYTNTQAGNPFNE